MFIDIENLSFSYPNHLILDDINFKLSAGSSLSILGANGSGKSTLLYIMLGFLKFKGSVKINGKNVCSYSKKELSTLISYVPQTHRPSYDYKVFEVALMGALNRTSLFSNFSKVDRNLTLQSLDKMGILHLKDEPYTKISGGERQLTYIARALVQGSRAIFMDEPTNGLDFGNQIKLLEMIKMLSNDGYTIIQTTHHPRHALFASNLVMLLKDTKIFKFGKSSELINAQNIGEIYNISYEKYKENL